MKQLLIGHCRLCDGTGSPGPYRDDEVCPSCVGEGSSLLYQIRLSATVNELKKEIELLVFKHVFRGNENNT